MNAYQAKLKDPRWQKKRLEILNRDDWACSLCHSKVDTLTVHHKDYILNTEPWDYPDDYLLTLCEDCHEKEGGREVLEKSILRHLRIRFPLNQLFILDDGLSLITKNNNDGDCYWLAETIRWLLSDLALRDELKCRFSEGYITDAKG